LPASPFLVEPAITELAIDADELRRQAENRLRGIVAEVAGGMGDVVIEQEVIGGIRRKDCSTPPRAPICSSSARAAAVVSRAFCWARSARPAPITRCPVVIVRR
jgi:hypothetical protein